MKAQHIVFILLIFSNPSQLSAQSYPDERIISGIASVIDGDTLDVRGQRIRLHGIDAPETGQNCGRQSGGRWPCGLKARDQLAAWIEGRHVDCHKLDTDYYGRIIARCTYLGEDQNARMVEAGLAWAYVRYSSDYTTQEARAQSLGRGIWQGEAEPAWAFRARRWEAGWRR